MAGQAAGISLRNSHKPLALVNILVTGWAGYIGPVVVSVLRESGHRLCGLDTNWYLPNHVEPAEWPDVGIKGDIRDGYGGKWPEAVVHLAGLSNDPLGDLHPNLTDRINYQATRDLMAALPDARHVFISSCSVYGASEMATELSDTHPLTVYAKSKLAVDDWMSDPYNGVNGVGLRLGTVYGFSPGHRLDLVVNKMVADAMFGKPIVATGNPSRPLVHIEDVARAIRMAVEEPLYGIYNVVGENWRIKDLAEHVSSYVGADIIYGDAGADQRDYMASSDRIRAEGWEPQHTVGGSLPVLAEKTLTLPPGEYTRIGAIQSLIERGILTPQLTRK
jgi:nucleoside-diphosphate-sugar epimerase